jgi:hypothetical protein
LTDTQILTIAISIIIPVAVLLYSNSRVGEVSNRIGDTHKRIDDLKADLVGEISNRVGDTNRRIDDTKSELSRRIDDTNSELSRRIDETNNRMDELKADLIKHIDNGFEHMGLLLKLHEAEHHKK